MQGSSEHLACPECGGTEFLLLANGKILCADDECYTLAGEWKEGGATGTTCRHCGRPLFAMLRLPDSWEDDHRQMVCPGRPPNSPHEPDQ
jgi:hypothetical protein